MELDVVGFLIRSSGYIKYKWYIGYWKIQNLYKEESKSKVNLLITSFTTICDKYEMYHFPTQSPTF